MAQLGDTVVTGSLAVSNCIYGSVTCATSATTATNACKGWNGSAFANFGSNAFNSTSFTTCTGTVTAITVSVNGISATSTAGCATASISLTNVPATSACCAKQICRCGYTGCCEFDVALTSGCSSVSNAYIYASCNSRLTFSTKSGMLSICSNDKCYFSWISPTEIFTWCAFAYHACVSNLLCTSNIRYYLDLNSTNGTRDIKICVACGTSSSHTDTCFIFCGCDGRMHGNVQGVLNAVTPSSPQNGDIWID